MCVGRGEGIGRPIGRVWPWAGLCLRVPWGDPPLPPPPPPAGSCSYNSCLLREPRSERSLMSTELSLGGSMVRTGRWAPRSRWSRHSVHGVLRRLLLLPPPSASRLSSLPPIVPPSPPQYSVSVLLGARSMESGDEGTPSSI